MLISVVASMTWPDATIGRHRSPNSVFEQYDFDADKTIAAYADEARVRGHIVT